MAHAGHAPHVVHDPEQGLAEPADAAYAAQREETLVDPSEHHGVGLLHPGMPVQWQAAEGGVDLEEGAAAEAVAEQQRQAVGQERPLEAPVGRRRGHVVVAGVLFGHKHAGVDATCAQRLHQAQRHNSRAPPGVALVDEDYFHFSCVLRSLWSLRSLGSTRPVRT